MDSVPHHIGFIMDGNRRWARGKGLPTFEGHQKGYEKLKEVGDWCFSRGVKVLTAFAFSTENWNRTKEEVSFLMNLLHFAMSKETDEFMRRNIQVRLIGRAEGLPENIQIAAREMEEKTKKNERGLLQLAVNYGGHAEIVDAVRAIVQKGLRPEDIDEKVVAAHLYGSDVPPPDLIVRTSGEQRLSGFLTWQSAYSELHFTQTHWPDFSEADLDMALQAYVARERRFGR
ncbi:MAG: polyprenyl diphosphate synthase [bacterium]|nr:polyprenyl diphosphate synthase [bacterium]